MAKLDLDFGKGQPRRSSVLGYTVKRFKHPVMQPSKVAKYVFGKSKKHKR